MTRALPALAAAAALLAIAPPPAIAQGDLRTETRYAPEPLWYLGPDRTRVAAGGRVRIVTGGGVAAALGVNEYMTYEHLYRAALARLSLRMPVTSADPLARREAVAGTIARYPSSRAAAFRLDPVSNPLVPGS